MKTVRLLSALITALTTALINMPVAHADNITSVLRKYNVGIEQVNTEALEIELSKASFEFTRIEAEYREKQSLIQTVDLTTKIIRDNIQANDINAASVDMRRKEDYLLALVNIDAEFEKIFEAEKEYRESQRQLGMALDVSGILMNRLESLTVYGGYLPATTYSDVEKAAKEILATRDKLAGAKSLADIGVIDNLSFPINYPATVSSAFGIRKDPFGGSGTEFHYGLDLSAPAGAEVTSLFNGVIARAGYDGGLGNYVIITHGKELQTLYAHLSEIKVKTGDVLKQHDVIGLVGSTGRSTGAHLHLGVYVIGQKVDPMKLFVKG